MRCFSYTCCSYTYVYIFRFRVYMTTRNVYIDEVYDHNRQSRMICMLRMHAYIEYVVILIMHTSILSVANAKVTFTKKLQN